MSSILKISLDDFIAELENDSVPGMHPLFKEYRATLPGGAGRLVLKLCLEVLEEGDFLADFLGLRVVVKGMRADQFVPAVEVLVDGGTGVKHDLGLVVEVHPHAAVRQPVTQPVLLAVVQPLLHLNFVSRLLHLHFPTCFLRDW